jgi:hypothetical protein
LPFRNVVPDVTGASAGAAPKSSSEDLAENEQ